MVGFVADGKETITYCQFDSYPSGVGADVLEWANGITDWDAVKVRAAAIVHVDDDTPPTVDQEANLLTTADYTVDNDRDKPSWYQVLRGTHGDPEAILKVGHAAHDPSWPGDSLFCEWGYMVDLDTGVLEVYRGFQTRPHKSGRFTDRPRTNGYYPIKLVASWPLADLPIRDAFLAALGPIENEE